MKKLILAISTLAISFNGMAQDKYVTSALTSMQSQNFEEAKDDIDKAMANPETKEKPKALFAKAEIYFALQMLPGEKGEKYKASSPYREGSTSLFKLVELKPEYEKETVDQLLLLSAYLYFNDGVKSYNDKKYQESTEFMTNVMKVLDMKAKRFANLPPQVALKFDSISADANQTMANSAYYAQKYDEAIPLLIKVKSNPITKTPTTYECLIDAYNKQKKSAEAYATIQEARTAFPDDVTIRNYELNYFILSGKQDELIKKLEDASAKEPNNADILFNIATTYLDMANPKDGKKPANTADLTAKSEAAFQRALKLAPENAGFNYNFGALYYNEATEVNDQMNAITGSSDADLKKYDALKAKRDGFFAQSSPYFEKAYTIYSANEASLKGDDTRIYKQTLAALKEVYARQNKLDKSAEMKKKYESMK